MTKNDLISAISEHSHTFSSKLLAVVGGTSAVSHTPAGAWISDAVVWFKGWPWMETLSYVAIILLIIERSFICWVWFEKKLFPWLKSRKQKGAQ